MIASAEQEGRSYEELKGQLELELAWVKQATHSRQQASLLCCVGGGGGAVCMCGVCDVIQNGGSKTTCSLRRLKIQAVSYGVGS